MWNTYDLKIKNEICVCEKGALIYSLYPIFTLIAEDGSATRSFPGWKKEGKPVGYLCRQCGGYQPYTKSELKILGLSK